MDKAIALSNCADELAEFGDYETSSDSLYLPRMMLKAAQQIWGRKPWTFKKSTVTIQTTSGNFGGYALPSDFSLFVIAESNTRTYQNDSVTFARCIDSTGNEVDVYLRRDSNEIYFVNDPDNATFTLNYVPKMANLDLLSLWPDDMEQMLIDLTKSKALANSENTVQMAINFNNIFEQSLEQYWTEQRRGNVISKGKTPIGAYGVKLIDSAFIGGIG
jgi:hypothetical protein